MLFGNPVFFVSPKGHLASVVRGVVITFDVRRILLTFRDFILLSEHEFWKLHLLPPILKLVTLLDNEVIEQV